MRLKCLAIALALFACFAMASDMGGERFTGFRLPYYRDDGTLAWVLESEEIRRTGEGEVQLLSPKVTVYSGEGGSEWISSILTAAKGKTELGSEQMLPSSPNASLSGGVRISVLDQEGEMTGLLSTDALDWDGKSEAASGAGEATIEFEESRVRGMGYRFEIKEERFHLERDISGTLVDFQLPAASSEGRASADVKCAGPAVFDLRKRKVELNDGVVVESEDDELTAEFLALSFGEGATLTSLEANGDVDVNSSRFEGSADRVGWDAKTNVVEFEGEPLRLSSGKWSYVADRGEYDAGLDRFLVRGVKTAEYEGEETVKVEFAESGELESTQELATLRGRPVVSGLLGEGTLTADTMRLHRGVETTEQALEATGDVVLEQGAAALTCSWLEYVGKEHRLEARDDVLAVHPDGSLSAASLVLVLSEDNEGVALARAREVELGSDEFSAWAEEAEWGVGEVGSSGLAGLASSALGSGTLTLIGKPRVHVRSVRVADEVELPEELVLTAEERVVVDLEKGAIEPVGSPEIRSGDIVIRSERLKVILDKPQEGSERGMAVGEVAGGGGVYVTDGRVSAEAESIRAYGAGRKAIKLMRDVRIRYPIETVEYTGEAMISAAGTAEWDLETGYLEISREVSLEMDPYRAKGDLATAKISPETNELEVVTLYGKPATVEGVDFSVPSEEITALVEERRVKIKKGYRGTWHIRGKSDEDQPGEEAAE